MLNNDSTLSDRDSAVHDSIPAPILDATSLQHYLKLDATLAVDPTGKPDESHQPSLIERRRQAADKSNGKVVARNVKGLTVAGVKPSANKVRAIVF